MLTKSEIEVLSELGENPEQRVPLRAVADRLDWSSGHTSRVVSNLEGRGLVRTEQSGTKRLVSASGIRPVEQLRDLTSDFSHVDFPELLSGASLEILYYLDTDRTATELAALSDRGRTTVYRRLNALQRVGIVGKDHSRYRLTKPFSALSELARSIARYDHRREAQARTVEISMVWERHDEYLFSCAAAVTADGFHQTGPAVFERFDIPLFTRERFHYFRSERRSELTAADVVCHTLLIDDSTRYRSYCLLLIVRQDIERSALCERAEHYTTTAELDLVAITDTLVSYLETEGDARTEQLPKWEAFKRTAADYDILL